ncbi:MAG TPA: MFS transporter [Micromonosporaceae bacterium]|jgi:Na+/melibiose symporter-like transporter
MRTTFRLLRRYRDLRLMLSAGLISLIGDWILRIGLSYYVYALTDSTVAAALVMLCSFVPSLLFGSVAGIFVDRWDRKRTMVIANLLLAVCLLPLVLVHDTSRVWIAYVVLFVEGSIAQFFAPAEQAYLPNLVADADLTSANAVNGQFGDLSRLIGSAAGGIVAAAAGLNGVTLLDAATFLVSAGLIGMMRAEGRAAPAEVAAEPPVGGKLAALRREWIDGLHVVARNRVLVLLTIFVLVTSTGEGIMGTLFVPFVRTVLHGSGSTYGVIVAVQAIGGVLGGLFATSLGQRFSASRLMGVGAVLFGLIDLAIFLYPLAYVSVWPAIVGMIVVGLPGAITMAGMMTLFQRNTTDSHRGRVFGALGVAMGAAILIGTLSAGWLGQSIGIVPVLAAQGVGYVLGGGTMLALLWSEPTGAVVAAPEDEAATVLATA